MELKCYSYDGGAPPMDSWPLEEKMGVVKQAALQGLIKAIRPPWLVCPGLGLCAGLDLYSTCQLCVPTLCLFKISVGHAHVLRPEEACVL